MKVLSDGTAKGTTLYDDDGRILHRIRHVTWDMESTDPHAKLTVELDVVPLSAIGREVVWDGLDEVPTEALEQELERRRNANA